VSARGRISSAVLEAYENGGNTAVAANAPAVEPVVQPTAEVDVKPKRRTRKKAPAEA
jgi:hypothetical protein